MQYLTQAGIKFLQESENLSDKQAGAEAWELMRGKVSGGIGYTHRRAKKEMHKAKPKNLSPEELAGMSSGGLAKRVLSIPKPVRKLGGLALIKLRGLAQRKTRGGVQNVSRMVRGVKSGDAPPVVTMSADSRTAGQPGHESGARKTLVGGRTRSAVGAATGSPVKAIEIPAEKYAGSAKRAKKWIASGARDKRRSELASTGQHLRGQDPRMG